MKQIPKEIIDFLNAQGFVIVSSIDKEGFPHSSCKAIVKINTVGRIYLVDAYYGVTAQNIGFNPRVSISAIDEHKFIGYCLKGKATIMLDNNITQEMIKTWEDNITGRLAKRLLRNLAENKTPRHHPEIGLPQPKHLIAVEVEQIVDLAPRHLKRGD